MNWWAVIGIVVTNSALLWAVDRFREARRNRKEYWAAIRVARDELRRDYAICRSICQFDAGTETPDFIAEIPPSAFSGEAYTSVRFRLATYLPQAIRAQLAAVYARASNMAAAVSTPAGKLIAPGYGDHIRMLDTLLAEELARSRRWALRRWVAPVIHPIRHVTNQREPEWPELPALSQPGVSQ